MLVGVVVCDASLAIGEEKGKSLSVCYDSLRNIGFWDSRRVPEKWRGTG